MHFKSLKVLGEKMFWVLVATSKYHSVLIADYGTVSLAFM